MGFKAYIKGKPHIILWVFSLFFSIPYVFYRFYSDERVDVNIYDTYFVFPTMLVFLILITFIFFVVYLIRMVGQKFKNITANFIFMFSNISMILILTFFISLVVSWRELPSNTAYPPLSGGVVENVGNQWNKVYNLLLMIQLILILLLAFSGVKTGVNYKKSG